MCINKFLFMFITTVFYYGCNSETTEREGEDTISGKKESITINVQPNYSNFENAGENLIEQDKTMSVLSYFFCQNNIIRKIEEVDIVKGGSVVLSQSESNNYDKLYIIGNSDLCEGVDKVLEGNEIILLDSLLVSYRGGVGHIERMVMSEMTTLPITKSLEINLERVMSRFDIVVEGEGIEISNVVVEGLALAGSIFGDRTESTKDLSGKFDTTFVTPLTSTVKGLFYAYERDSNKQGEIRVDLKHNGKAKVFTIPLDEIKRNRIYQINVKYHKGTVDCSLTLAGGMEDGDVGEASNGLIIDQNKTKLTGGALIESNNQRLILPYGGSSGTLVFTGGANLVLVKQEGNIDNLVLTAQEKSNPLSFSLSIPANRRISSGDQALILSFAPHDDQTNKEKFQQIVIVSKNFAEVEVVTMAGIDWMQFNAVGSDPALYPIFKEGETIETFYRKNWTYYTGKARQWGARPGKPAGNYTYLGAWEYYYAYDYHKLPDINGGIIGGSSTQKWIGKDSPCPKGWRPPTIMEYKKIWPANDTRISDSEETEYTTPSGTFKMSIKIINSYKNLVIKDIQNNELHFPISGFRTPDMVNGGGVDGYGWNVGKESYYWCYERGASVGIKNGVILNKTTQGLNQNSWNNLRCVRDI